MNKLSAFEFEMLNQHVEQGWIRRQICQYARLFIYTYSAKTEIEEYWNKYTRMSRGLVIDDKGRVVIKCIPKFFNSNQKYAEQIDFQDSETEITVKNDGYLIQIKKDHEYGLVITSKGSFNSPMVNKAKTLIAEEGLEEDYTYICELCCNFPGDESIIVKRWDCEPKLTVWAVIDPDGNEISLSEAKIPSCLERTEVLSYKEAIEYLNRLDVEGVVVKNGSKRVKIKTEHFVEMHRLISDLRKVRVLDLLSEGKGLDELSVPDEFLPLLKEWESELKSEYDKYYYNAITYKDTFEGFSDKQFAEQVGFSVPKFYGTLVFSLRKNKSISDIIWRRIRQNLKEES